MSLFEDDSKKPSFGSEEEEPTWFQNLGSFIWETIKVIIISLVIIIPVRYFLIQPFYVQGASMEPNFFDREYLIIDEITYRFDEVARGDIVVFRYPKDPKQFFIKRIIGLPGEELEINNNTIIVYDDDFPDGQVIDEAMYLPSELKTIGNLRISLGEDEYYVLGDNRTSSLDSRVFGPVRAEAIVGRVWLRGWPIARASVIKRPKYK